MCPDDSMPQASVRTIHVAMKGSLFRPNHEEYASFCCLHCHMPLEVLMPSPDQPERLMGICHPCGEAWYLIDPSSGRMESVIVLLPPSQDIRDAFSSANGDMPA
jgi:hypothetical protein